MSRVQLALNVDSLDDAIGFYSKLFGTGPAKVRPGYANFAIAEPPLKLVLIEGGGPAGSVNHLGVEVAGPSEVLAEAERLGAAGLPISLEGGTTCCFAVQDKVWVDGPDGARWEVYTVLDDLADSDPSERGAACCTTESDLPAAVPAQAPTCC